MRVLVLLLSFLFAAPCLAEGYPERAIRMIVPYPAGGSTDILARAILQPLTEILGKPVIIDNKSGAGGIIGTTEAARATPDGYTIVFGNLGPNALNASLYKKLAYDPIRDFIPISKVVDVPFLLVTAPSTGISSVTDLIARGKKDPNTLTYASVGQGSASHVTAELFRRQAGIEMRHVPYRGGAPATNDTLAGQVSVYFITPLEGMGQVQAGMLKSLGISTAERSPLFPDMPTIHEALPGFQVVVWFGILAPAGVPPEIVARLNDAVTRAVATPSVQEALKKLGVEPKSSTSEAFAATIRTDIDKWAKVVKEANITLD
ncbi:tripartite tricarboxylate transporter substrate binding protein [Bradyrhizobium daqingense]|uniref:Tripartite-type tricarboxylate transporter receptor subunit TctC n=1 Tax=Bradyrhizobium daqingense TaxID=993502 RepID=A0A562KTM3_9BRAD|nr:tripartite tricarboxylate transporter substrate binding protein [Bradyrhizobium daqingense]TWH98707.1 tripartite-type tricarboxylate transporter receptor subunit TctC [Bradyrhizobium daqingense]UFS86097.1 tripartite tricarboxylate transporter substrate binding protein [Bradyrhizobium daqingense]